MSKITGIPMVDVATKLIMGEKLKDLGYSTGIAAESKFFAVKAPVFSFSKLTTVDTFLGPEMKSTGEVMGVDKDYNSALYKAFIGSGVKIPSGGSVLLSVADRNKKECIEVSRKLASLGFRLFATEDTYSYLSGVGVEVDLVQDNEIIEAVKKDKIQLVINTPTKGKISSRSGFHLRRTAMEYSIPCLTSLDTTNAMLEVMDQIIHKDNTEIYSLDEYSRYIKEEEV
jgi:carbamoyl-phosphate synthase large subunit